MIMNETSFTPISTWNSLELLILLPHKNHARNLQVTIDWRIRIPREYIKWCSGPDDGWSHNVVASITLAYEKMVLQLKSVNLIWEPFRYSALLYILSLLASLQIVAAIGSAPYLLALLWISLRNLFFVRIPYLLAKKRFYCVFVNETTPSGKKLRILKGW